MAFPTDPNDVDIELYYDSTWNNINSYVYHRDASPIIITRGRANEGKRCDPGSMSCQLNNRDGRFSPRNPNSPLFGKIGRNTQIRVSVTYNAVTYVRFVGEIVSWPSRWDVSGKDIWVPLKAAGLLRRLGQGTKPIRSPLYRTMLGGLLNDIPAVAYWPMEDGANSLRFASAVPGGAPLAVVSPAELATDAQIVGSQPLPLFGVGAGASGAIPEHTDTGVWYAQVTALTDDFVYPVFTPLSLEVASSTLGLVAAGIQSGPPFAVAYATYDHAGVVVTNGTSAMSIDPTGVPLSVVLGMKDNASGTDDFLYVRVMTGDGTVVGSIDVNLGPGAYGRGTVARPNGRVQQHDNGIVGHFAYYTDPTFTLGEDDVANALAISGHDGEDPDDRFARVCGQLSIAYEVVGTSSQAMGPERAVTQLQVLRDVEDVDQGFLHETRDQLGLRLRTNSSRYNQIPVTLSYETKGLAHPLDPEPDDLNVANDREVKRRNGSSARRELTSGPLSVEDPPDGIGRIDDSITIDAYADDQLENIAGWRLHVGTWDAERYPRVRVDLSANASLIPTVVPLDSGDYLKITDLPTWLPPEDADLIVEGYSEVIGFYDWDIVFNTSPAGPYGVVGRWALLSKELHAAINSSVTSIDIANTDVTQPMLATSAADIGSGYGITIGGEEMQVTAVAASTITLGAVGTAAHAVNANVTPGIPASVATGNLLLCLAAIRNSGTGVPNTPTGYTRLAVFPATANVQLFAKIATSGAEAAPTVSFTGGAANQDTSAQMARLTGKWHSTANVVIGAAARLNASAQNITIPGLAKPIADNAIIIYLGWKQDDWSSVTFLGGAPGIGSGSTTTGDDQAFAWAYETQSTAAGLITRTFDATGGASAISRGAIVALRCDYQSATVTRSTNGITASHSAADAVTMTKPMRWGLL